MSHAADSLGPDGSFAAHVDQFTPRPEQQQMASAIEAAIDHDGIFVAESGTGTGKTFAYLVPALASGKKVLISTGTKHLQDQIFNNDLPLVRQVLEVPVSAALLKGRVNYLCLEHLKRAEERAAGIDDAAVRELALIRSWQATTKDGDIAGNTTVPEDSPHWRDVTSTTDNCLGSKCEDYDACYVRQARKAALEADVVVINHHLFFADLVLREEGFGQLLPGAQAVIFDEAHQLPEIATAFFGTTVSGHQIQSLCRDCTAADLKEQSGIDGFRKTFDELDKAAADFRLAMGRASTRGSWSMLKGEKFHAAKDELAEAMEHAAAVLEQAAPRGEALANCQGRMADLLERYYRLIDEQSDDQITWFETGERSFQLHQTPMEVSSAFAQTLEMEPRAWVFTSATLAVKGDFTHFVNQLGLEHADTACWGSPYDYQNIALCYLPTGLPEPRHPEFVPAVIESAVPVIEASGGRAFFLFTSYRALRQAAEVLPDRIDYPILVQGEAPRSELIQRFRELGNAVLLGTSSFWEGVDVQGEALSCVIIDKLPFAAPDDPVLRARGEAMERQGRNPFMEYQVPQAVIALKQGVGRLIRSESDRGVLMLCDPRLTGKPYGKIFLASLPPMRQTRQLEDVQAFFAVDTPAVVND